MRENSSISLYRDRLDETLTSDDLVNVVKLRTLVKDQIVRSLKVGNEEYVDNIVETRTKELSNFLGMLRSASVDDQRSKYKEASHGCWKVKQDTEEFRVMYREGPEGTPLHTLLVEGYVDGPLDVCLCISWEAGLYPKWWPQITIPCFRLISSERLQNIRVGEQICLLRFVPCRNQTDPIILCKSCRPFEVLITVLYYLEGRMKLSWPLSTREALLHYFEFEYFQNNLLVVLFNSISDLESIDIRTHGFTRDGIPDPQDVVRIDVVGGFAVQKVSDNRSYFRTITNLDVKLDFLPPAFINFISRQVLGSGFNLYKKEVALVVQGDEDFGKALNHPLYTRIGEALQSNGLSTGSPQPEDLKNDTSILFEEQLERKDEVRSTQEMVHHDDLAVDFQLGDLLIQDKRSHGEIEEIKENDSEGSECFAELHVINSCDLPTNKTDTMLCTDNKKVAIRPEVEQALTMLDQVISVFEEYRSNDDTRLLPGIPNENSENLKNIEAKESISSEADQICRNARACAQSVNKEDPEMTAAYEPRNSPESHGSRRKVAPASPDKNASSPAETHHSVAHSSENQTTEWTIPEKTAKEDLVVRVDEYGAGGNNARSKNRNPWHCCFRSHS